MASFDFQGWIWTEKLNRSKYSHVLFICVCRPKCATQIMETFDLFDNNESQFKKKKKKKLLFDLLHLNLNDASKFRFDN